MRGGARAPTLGRTWEARAAQFLGEKGMRIISRGYRCRLGEIDIIGVDGTALVVVEVRARASGDSAIETIGSNKRRRIVNATRHFLMRNPEWFSRRIRFDVIAIDRIDSTEPEIQWVRNAFDES
jgi:putative endonuclease